MKKIFLPALILALFAGQLAAQTEHQIEGKHKIGLSFSSFGSNNMLYFQSLEGAASYNSDNFYVLGANYTYSFNKTLSIETGIEYAKHRIIIEPNLPPNYDAQPYSESFSLLEIPFYIRADFLNYFFVNTGTFITWHIQPDNSVDSQSGMGAFLGIAIKYDFKQGLSLFVNPYLKAHSLIAFQKSNHQLHLMETGFRFGITYRL